MKILLVHNTHQHRGGEDVVFDQERRMLESAGHRVLTYHRTNDEIGKLNILGQIDLARRTIWSSESRAEFDAILAAEQPDIVHVHNTFIVISPSIYSACRERGIPVVLTLHNFRLMCPPSNLFRDNHICEECIDHSLFRAIRHRCYRESAAASSVVVLMLAWHRLIKTLDRSVHRYIALTDFSCRKFVASGFPVDKISVKPNFLESDPGPQQKAGDYALYIGRFSSDKGISTLLDAWNQLPRDYPLQIVGDGAERPELEELAKRRGLINVTFRGFLSREDIVATLKGAKFLVMPSLWYETFGMVIVEAFACGVPVICSRLGAMQEIVDDQVNGLHFSAGDPADLAQKVKYAWQNPQIVESMGKCARQTFEAKYTVERNYEMLMQIYQQAFESHARSNSSTAAQKHLALSNGADAA